MKKNITFSRSGTSFYNRKLREALFAQLKMLFTSIGATHNPDSNNYSFNTLDNVSEEEMIEIYNNKEAIDKLDLPQTLQGCNIRSIVACRGDVGTRLSSRPLQGEATFADTPIEVLKFGHTQLIDSTEERLLLPCKGLNGTFKECNKLHTIYPINISEVTNIGDDTFEGCTALKEIRLCGLCTTLNIEDSPQTSSSSLAYIITNASSDGEKEIKLHPCTYKQLVGLTPSPDTATTEEWNSIYEAVARKNIKLTTNEFIAYTKEATFYVNFANTDDCTLILDDSKISWESNTLKIAI